jgi:hypothetical protein
MSIRLIIHSRDVNERQLTNCKGVVEVHNHCSFLRNSLLCEQRCSITQGNRACLINKKTDGVVRTSDR